MIKFNQNICICKNNVFHLSKPKKPQKLKKYCKLYNYSHD